MSIAARLQQVRGAATRKEVAAHLGVHANSVANYEHGRDPPASYLTAIAERYGIRPFVLTVDPHGNDYLREMCDGIGYEVLADVAELPLRLVSLYRGLTGG